MQTIDYQRVNGGGKLSNLTWKEFVFGEEFSITATGSGIDKNKLITGEGDTPYITRTDCLNGIDGFIPEQASKYRMDEGNVITIGLDTQTVFYQPKAFYTGQNIQIIRHPQLDKYNAMFIIVAIQKLVERFSWGSYGATLTRLRKSRIYLPANKDGQPDFAFMSSFMQQVEQDILGTTLRYFADKQQITPPHANNEINWQVFLIRDILIISAGKRLTKADMQIGNRPFIGATDNYINNGITEWVNNTNESIDQNLLGVNYNGSVGEVFYHPYECIFSDDVKRLHLKKQLDSKYILLFIKTAIVQQKIKYAYGYKFNEQRMLKQPIMLPCTPEGTPDWQYMENYMRHIESQQIVKYLQHYTKYIAD